jgi:hypothetical protein
MFHWICPECGQEIAPGVKECPVCEPGSEHQSSPAPLLPAGHSPAVAPAPEVAPITPVAASAMAVLEPPAPLAEEPLPEPPRALHPEVVLEPEVVLQPEIVERPEPQINRETSPLSAPPESAPPEPETFADRLADLAERLQGDRIPYTAQQIIPSKGDQRAHAEEAGDRVPAVPTILDVTPGRPLLAPPPSMRLLAEPQPPSVAREFSAREVFNPRPAEHLIRSHAPMGAEPSVPEPVRMPDRPGRVAAPALAPFQDYYKAADRQMRPAAKSTTAAGSETLSKVEPKVTLPGPALPRELMSLQAAGLVSIWRRRRHAAPNRFGWTTRIVVLAILLTAGIAAAFRVMPGTSPTVHVKQISEPAADTPVTAAKPDRSHSLARFVEVTGVRFMEVNKKPQIRYLVVNHSSAPLGSVTVYVTLHASNSKPGQPPLSRFSFRSPILAAFEAKEMASPIERVVGPLDLPDWQDLQADVEVQ